MHNKPNDIIEWISLIADALGIIAIISPVLIYFLSRRFKESINKFFKEFFGNKKKIIKEYKVLGIVPIKLLQIIHNDPKKTISDYFSELCKTEDISEDELEDLIDALRTNNYLKRPAFNRNVFYTSKKYLKSINTEKDE
jgi:hypothetical protein